MLHTIKNHCIIYSHCSVCFLYTYSCTSADSINSGSCSSIVFTIEKVYLYNGPTVQSCIVQGSTVHTFMGINI